MAREEGDLAELRQLQRIFGNRVEPPAPGLTEREIQQQFNMNTRWLREPPMTQEEARRWVTKPRLTKRFTIMPHRPLREVLRSMQEHINNANPVVQQNVNKIIQELRKEIENHEGISKAELNKQKAEALRQAVVSKGIPPSSAQGPIKNIMGFAGLPEVRPRIAGRKTRKSKSVRRKSTRKVRR
jgi:hypothetical protein